PGTGACPRVLDGRAACLPTAGMPPRLAGNSGWLIRKIAAHEFLAHPQLQCGHGDLLRSPRYCFSPTRTAQVGRRASGFVLVGNWEAIQPTSDGETFTQGFPAVSAEKMLSACGHFPSQLVEEVHEKDQMFLRLLRF